MLSNQVKSVCLNSTFIKQQKIRICICVYINVVFICATLCVCVSVSVFQRVDHAHVNI